MREKDHPIKLHTAKAVLIHNCVQSICVPFPDVFGLYIEEEVTRRCR